MLRVTQMNIGQLLKNLCVATYSKLWYSEPIRMRGGTGPVSPLDGNHGCHGLSTLSCCCPSLAACCDGSCMAACPNQGHATPINGSPVRIKATRLNGCPARTVQIKATPRLSMEVLSESRPRVSMDVLHALSESRPRVSMEVQFPLCRPSQGFANPWMLCASPPDQCQPHPVRLGYFLPSRGGTTP